MLQSIHLQGFKGFKDTEVGPFRKVNLILGGQNVGKTSLLEAVYFGASDLGNYQRLPAVFRLAEGHDAQRFLSMTFKGVKASIALEFGLEKLLIDEDDEPKCASLITEINLPKRDSSDRDYFGGLVSDYLQLNRVLESRTLRLTGRVIASLQAQSQTPLAISVNLPTQAEAVQLFDRVVLKRKKRILLEALRRIEPRLEDMHSLSPDGEQRVYLELDGLATAVPLPQLGHGFSRLLTLYCSLLVTDAKLALMDEVENGIHYASLPTLFKGVHDMATTQDVQTLMTTHSWDAIRAACEVFADTPELFQVIRLERTDDNIKAVCIEGERMLRLMAQDMEVR